MEIYRPLSADKLEKQWRTMGNYYQSLSRAVTDAMLNQWKCMVSPFRVGIQMMDAFLPSSESSEIASGSKGASGLATQAEAESLEKPALERLKSGHAAPRESYELARWAGIRRDYTTDDVARLRGSVHVEYTLARRGAEKLWQLLHSEPYVAALGALTGNQALQMVEAGLKSIYLSGWQVAADANLAGQMYPDQSLYPCNSAPCLVRAINNAFRRADQIRCAEGHREIDYFVPIVADAEAGFGGPLNAFELMKAMIEAGAAGVHFEDQMASQKKCGHMGGKVLVPTRQFLCTLKAARLAADILDVPTLIVARTDADSAHLLTNDVDERDSPFLTGERTREGFYRVTGGLNMAINRGLSYAPYADLVWCETSEPDLKEAQEFAEAIHERFPDKLLAYNCSPSFNWKAKLDDETIARFQRELGALGYKYQFITLAGFHALNLSMFELARGYRESGMTAYTQLQESEFEHQPAGYHAVKHQSFVGTGYFDQVAQCVAGGQASTTALTGSTEEAQFVAADDPSCRPRDVVREHAVV
jgi:isocitrate lyase